ncbi:hypothetical protein ATN89_17375 [Comamonas thiooxydans]|uniref:crAss001_48 related protein n=1 Tax=Comamonas thiooxydans TaxID=363952 RepID=UPI0007C4399C|nr:hypothetical protein [Comamonas thiooxydans]OAD82855.1 hypothetical protein ATN89_17375 [Comamonas thiooxydans]
MTAGLMPHELRVVHEKNELDERLAKLNSFIAGEAFAKLDWEDSKLLVRQSGLMTQLQGVLADRIARFSAKK